MATVSAPSPCHQAQTSTPSSDVRAARVALTREPAQFDTFTSGCSYQEGILRLIYQSFQVA